MFYMMPSIEIKDSLVQDFIKQLSFKVEQDAYNTFLDNKQIDKRTEKQHKLTERHKSLRKRKRTEILEINNPSKLFTNEKYIKPTTANKSISHSKVLICTRCNVKYPVEFLESDKALHESRCREGYYLEDQKFIKEFKDKLHDYR